jgi:hypothetical protein
MGCERQPGSTSAAAQEKAATPGENKSQPPLYARTKQADGRFATVGVFKFSPDGKVELTVTGSGADADRLRAAWREVEARPELKTKAEDAQGTLAGKPVGRGTAEYPVALADVMSREFGFFLSPIEN